jgi:hypothetical protein
MNDFDPLLFRYAVLLLIWPQLSFLIRFYLFQTRLRGRKRK